MRAHGREQQGHGQQLPPELSQKGVVEPELLLQAKALQVQTLAGGLLQMRRGDEQMSVIGGRVPGHGAAFAADVQAQVAGLKAVVLPLAAVLAMHQHRAWLVQRQRLQLVALPARPAAVAAGVPRFIPSDFASDYTKLAPGDNRNFDLRREFKALLDQAPIAATSILNGAFGEILGYNIPLLDFKQQQVSYWEGADWPIDFTTMDDTARLLRIASFQLNIRAGKPY